MVMLGLGDSVGTHAAKACRREVLVVAQLRGARREGGAARGRIVLFNVPFTNYGETVRFRAAGPSRAARHGAVAALVRAVGPAGLRTPHTGALQYAERRAEDSGRGDLHRRCRSTAAHGRPRRARSSSG